MNREKETAIRNFIVNDRALKKGYEPKREVDMLILGGAVDELRKTNHELKTENDKLKAMCMNGILASSLDHDWNSIMYQIKCTLQDVECEKTRKKLQSSLSLLNSKKSILGEMDTFGNDRARMIKGKDIETFLNGYYDPKRWNKKIEFNIDEDYKIYAHRTNLFGLLLNILNNSFTWTNEKISVYTKDNKLVIVNDGEKIEDDCLESVFRIGYTKSVGGHGYGLSLSKELNKSYLDVYATNDKELNIYDGACFVIEESR